MQSIFKFVILLCAVCAVLSSATRPRGFVQNQEVDNEAESANRLERNAGGHHHDVVDFGAHTGHKGSFGWYADFPVLTHHGHH